jgi:hypothetical protein
MILYQIKNDMSNVLYILYNTIFHITLDRKPTVRLKKSYFLPALHGWHDVLEL